MGRIGTTASSRIVTSGPTVLNCGVLTNDMHGEFCKMGVELRMADRVSAHPQIYRTDVGNPGHDLGRVPAVPAPGDRGL